jgi:hydroxyacylglutathione hydrolase
MNAPIAIPNGRWKQNCYLLSDKLGQSLIIDPGSESKKIIEQIEINKLLPIAILNTHAHYDHIGSVVDLVNEFHVPFYLHGDDKKLLKQANLYKIVFGGKEKVIIPEVNFDLSNLSDEITIDTFKVRVLHTPGHTDGSVCFLINKILFSGDTLLPGGSGRVDLPGGDASKLSLSMGLLRSLPLDLVTYPGHGQPFTLQEFWGVYDQKSF